MTTIDGQPIHFIHVRSAEAGALPLVLSHGWPGSVVEFLDAIGPLTDPAAHGGDPADAFDVVVPSLPGYGFSGPTTAPGWHPRRMASAFAVLMGELGYDHYGAQGGLGIHRLGQPGRRGSGSCDRAAPQFRGCRRPGGRRSGGAVSRRPTRPGRHARRGAEQAPATRRSREPSPEPRLWPAGLARGTGRLDCREVQSLERLSRRGRDVVHEGPALDQRDGVLGHRDGHVIDASVLRDAVGREGGGPRPSHRVPNGCRQLSGRDHASPRHWVEARYNLTHWTDMPRGGHFAAMEVPDLFVDDVRAFSRPCVEPVGLECGRRGGPRCSE